MTGPQQRWQQRPLTAAVLRVLVVLGPLLLAVGAGTSVAALLDGAARVPLALLATGAVLLLTGRLARRLLPLAALLRLSLLFPSSAPDRMSLALRAGSTRELARLAQSRDEAGRAAEQLLLLLASVARHDPGTRRHSERVRAYVEVLAEQLRLPEADRDRLRWAALVHDLGKTRVDATVLRKPSRLDEREWRLVREHPAEGARLAAGLQDFLGPWFGGIGDHHERWDGTGYPRGLAGEQISYAGRIVGVADAFEVMTATRPYKLPVDPATATAELARCAGTQFDPAVVRALLDVPLRRLRRVLGPFAVVGLLPALGARLPDVDRAVSSGSDVGVPAVPPLPEPEQLPAAGLHPDAGLHPEAALALAPTGADDAAAGMEQR